MTFVEWCQQSGHLHLLDDAGAEAAWDAATKAEREACAQACDSIVSTTAPNDGSYITDLEFGKASGAEECAATIRAR